MLSVFVSSIRFNTSYVASLLCNIPYLTTVTIYTYNIWLYFLIFTQSGDVGENPGPQHNSCQSFSIFHWNLNCICAHDFIKSSLLHTYIAANPCDILCLCETFLNSGILSDDVHLNIPGYNLERADHPANTKRGDVCIYFQKSLSLRTLDIQFLHECINFEMRIGDKVCNFISLYRSPNQSLEESETFANKLEAIS